ncbi:MAG TPA: cytochrome C [Methylomirabilota bacterium]|jgi:cytochrome c1|nr:cytochrome C [Methylomirabilota bacterium]
MKEPRAAVVVTFVASLVVGLGACDGDKRAPRVVTDGDRERGRQAVESGACHRIPGVRSARGIIGPSLKGLAAGPYIVGRMANDASNLVAWIRGPRVLDPQTIMPDLTVSEPDARDIAAFLFAGGPITR